MIAASLGSSSERLELLRVERRDGALRQREGDPVRLDDGRGSHLELPPRHPRAAGAVATVRDADGAPRIGTGSPWRWSDSPPTKALSPAPRPAAAAWRAASRSASVTTAPVASGRRARGGAPSRRRVSRRRHCRRHPRVRPGAEGPVEPFNRLRRLRAPHLELALPRVDLGHDPRRDLRRPLLLAVLERHEHAEAGRATSL